MTTAGELRSGKGHRDENFPVASRLIDPRHRGIILAFYEFVRVADDIADHATLERATRSSRSSTGWKPNLLGKGDDNRGSRAAARRARRARRCRRATRRTCSTAFRMDVTKLRYRDWDDLIDYCSYSAMPVGRFVLDVHGESRATWPANDALCAALQIINHLQDCGKDFRDLNRVYIPLDALAAAGATPEELGATRASPAAAALPPRPRGAHRAAARRRRSRSPAQIANTRLALEVAVIHTLARRLVALLQRRDPLSERVHLSKAQFALYGLARYHRSTRCAGSGAPRAAQSQCAQTRCVSSRVAVAETQDSAAQRASGSSFYAAMRILPRAQREAMFEIYSFCRKVDDIADSTRAARRAARAARAAGAPTSTRSTPAARSTRARGLAGAGQARSACGARISSP